MTPPAGLWLLVIALCGLVPRSGQAAVTIDVRGRARLVASADCDAPGTSCTVRGALQDDLSQAMADQTVRATLDNGFTSSAQTEIQDCSSLSEKPTSARETSTVTSGTGEFCFRISSAELISGALRLAFAGDARTDPDSIRVDLRVGLHATDIDWLDPRKQLELEATKIELNLQLRGAKEMVLQQRLSLTVYDQSAAHEVFRAIEATDSTGTARFQLRGNQLGSVGVGRLEVVFGGAAQLAPTRRSWPFTRVCHVRLRPKEFEREPNLGRNIVLSVTADAQCGRRTVGIVEFSARGQTLYRAPIENNEARWELSTGPYGPGALSVSARYIPPAEGWLASDDTHFELVIAPAGTTSAAFWLLASAGLLGWLAVKWRHSAVQPLLRSSARKKVDADLSLDRSPPEPGRSGWYGSLIDAHTGLPIPNADVRIEQPEFTEKRTAASTVTSPSGEFVLPALDPLNLSRLVIEARYYSDGRWPLPPQGRLTIRMQTVRRAVLHAFVNWFESSISKGQRNAEPTPAQVRLDLGMEQPPQIIEWAESVEKAAFGPTVPDRHANSLVSGPAPPSRLGKEL